MNTVWVVLIILVLATVVGLQGYAGYRQDQTKDKEPRSQKPRRIPNPTKWENLP